MGDVPEFYHRWTTDEIYSLMNAVQLYGLYWSVIRAQALPRIKERSIRNKYADIKRRYRQAQRYANRHTNLVTDLHLLMSYASQELRQHSFSKKFAFEHSGLDVNFQPLSLTDRMSLQTLDFDVYDNYETQRNEACE